MDLLLGKTFPFYFFFLVKAFFMPNISSFTESQIRVWNLESKNFQQEVEKHVSVCLKVDFQ